MGNKQFWYQAKTHPSGEYPTGLKVDGVLSASNPIDGLKSLVEDNRDPTTLRSYHSAIIFRDKPTSRAKPVARYLSKEAYMVLVAFGLRPFANYEKTRTFTFEERGLVAGLHKPESTDTNILDIPLSDLSDVIEYPEFEGRIFRRKGFWVPELVKTPDGWTYIADNT